MDPNEVLDRILERVSRVKRGDLGCAVFLVNDIEALDEWLHKGGFLPERWKRLTDAVDPQAKRKPGAMGFGHD